MPYLRFGIRRKTALGFLVLGLCLGGRVLAVTLELPKRTENGARSIVLPPEKKPSEEKKEKPRYLQIENRHGKAKAPKPRSIVLGESVYATPRTLPPVTALPHAPHPAPKASPPQVKVSVGQSSVAKPLKNEKMATSQRRAVEIGGGLKGLGGYHNSFFYETAASAYVGEQFPVGTLREVLNVHYLVSDKMISTQIGLEWESSQDNANGLFLRLAPGLGWFSGKKMWWFLEGHAAYYVGGLVGRSGMGVYAVIPFRSKARAGRQLSRSYGFYAIRDLWQLQLRLGVYGLQPIGGRLGGGVQGGMGYVFSSRNNRAGFGVRPGFEMSYDNIRKLRITFSLGFAYGSRQANIPWTNGFSLANES